MFAIRILLCYTFFSSLLLCPRTELRIRFCLFAISSHRWTAETFHPKIIIHVISNTLFAEFKYTYVNKAILHFTSVKAISGASNNPKSGKSLSAHSGQYTCTHNAQRSHTHTHYMTFHVISIFIMNVFRNYLLFVSFMELFGMYDFIELCFCHRCHCRCTPCCRLFFKPYTWKMSSIEELPFARAYSLSRIQIEQTKAIDCVIQFEWYSLK